MYTSLLGIAALTPFNLLLGGAAALVLVGTGWAIKRFSKKGIRSGGGLGQKLWTSVSSPFHRAPSTAVAES